LLLFEESEQQNYLKNEVEKIKSVLNDPNALSEKIDPLIDIKVEYIKENFPELFGPMITASISKQIAESQDEVVNALYPVMGKLIKEYIRHEIKKLRESLKTQAEQTFSPKFIRRRVKSWVTGTSSADWQLTEINTADVENILIIDQQSGLLLGYLNEDSIVDKDAVAGLLTAIKQFGEQTLSNNQDDIREIEFGNRNLFLINFKRHYLVCFTKGIASEQFMSGIRDFLLEFSSNHLKNLPAIVTNGLVEDLSSKLKSNFESNSN